MRIASAGHALFAFTMIGLGIMGLIQGNFTPIWNPVPNGIPLRELLVYLTAFISLTSGIGLLWRRTAAFAAGLQLTSFAILWLLFRLPQMVLAPGVDTLWSGCGETLVMIAAAWILYVWFAGKRETKWFAFVCGDKALYIARALCGVAMITFGVAHFIYLKHTADMVPSWLPWHEFWAYFTGGALIAAGVAMIVGLYARLAAELSALELALFLFLVWIPVVAVGSKDAFQWSETIVSWALMAGACVVAESYRGTPRLSAKPLRAQ